MSDVNRVRRRVFSTVIGFALLVGIFPPVDAIKGDAIKPVSQEPQTKLEKVVNEIPRRWDIGQVPSAGLTIVAGDQSMVLRLGKAEKGMFELASTSKAFTGLLIALLEQEQRLKREDAITDWIPELAEHPQMGYSAVQIQDLLSHRSGIAENTIDLLRPNTAPDALSHLPALLKNVPLAYPVGTQEEYATLNYSLLGLVAERATGKPFSVLLKEKVFQPLGMKHTFVEERISGERTTKLLIPGYKISFTVARPYDAPRYLQNTPAGYVLSTPEDMAIWLQFLLHKLSPNHSLSALYAALAQVQRPHAQERDDGYAYGWDVETDQTTYWSHPGQNPNAAAYVAFDPQAGVGIALLGNSNSPQVMELGRSIFHYLRGTSGQMMPERFATDVNDGIFTVAATIFWLVGALLLLAAIYKRKSGRKNLGKSFLMTFIVLNTLLISVLAMSPAGFLAWSWPNLLVWGPVSLPVAAAGLIFFANTINLFFNLFCFNPLFFRSVKVPSRES
ncbi:beta-lactamase family protein [Xenorhabdus sp. DI]|uniref:serine hydrolase domain-containing protein n=1 Tax=Xenorhabdus doucetiae TaxID=351671 RepID=UPI00199ADABB|nr:MULTISPECIES: serine hydrolase domain-containing protein [unclassified Xenorhabdus]MBD2785012.1 beta-lactamase family protein [Xenorhabdus sp. 3]MBD2787099.1 beta-lactamase family protein [Xenorhabdus sp. DI]